MDHTEKQYKIFIRNYLLHTSLYNFIFAYAVYNVMFKIRGLSVFEISLLHTFWCFTSFVFEIPSGAAGDRWNRRTLLTVAPLIKSLCFIIWICAGNNIYILGAGFMMWSFGSSLVSGTAEAFLYDELYMFNRTNEYEKIIGKRDFYYHLALAFSVLMGGFIAQYSIDLTLKLSVIPLFLSSFFASRLKQTSKVKETEHIKYREYIRIAFSEVFSNKILRILFFYSFCISIFGELEEFDQLYYEFAGLPIYGFGIAGFFWALLNAVSCNYAYLLKNKNWVLYIFPLLSAILLICVGIRPHIYMIILLLTAHFISAPLNVLINSKIQRNISSVSRATVTSVCFLLINFLGILAIPVFGVISKYYGLPYIYISAGIFLVFFSFWSIIKRKIIGGV